jgi:hypothetical protein
MLLWKRLICHNIYICVCVCVCVCVSVLLCDCVRVLKGYLTPYSAPDEVHTSACSTVGSIPKT